MTTQDRPPRVSIGIPVFNAERFLPATLRSLLEQSFTDIEFVISDNASTDSTQEICRRFQLEDPRILYFRNDLNLGVCANYNRTAELSRGTYFKWSSSNDLCHPEYISDCVKVLDSNPDVVLCYASTRLIKDDGIEQDYDNDFALLESRPSERWLKLVQRLQLNNPLTGLIRRETLLQTTMLGPYAWSDMTAAAELSLYGKFYLLPEVRFYRNMRSGTYSQDRSETERRRSFEPATVGQLQFREWRRLYEYLRGACLAPIPLSEKWRIGIYQLRRANWERAHLVNELIVGLKWIMGR